MNESQTGYMSIGSMMPIMKKTQPVIGEMSVGAKYTPNPEPVKEIIVESETNFIEETITDPLDYTTMHPATLKKIAIGRGYCDMKYDKVSLLQFLNTPVNA